MQTPEDRAQTQKNILTYLFFTFSFSSVFYYLVISTGKLGAAGGNYVLGIMWCPALAAFTACKLRKKSVGELGWRWPGARDAVWSYAIPLIYALAAYTIVWTTGLAKFFNPDFVKQIATTYMWTNRSPAFTLFFYVFFAATLGMIKACASALGEEIGWRGFLVPELSKITSFPKTALISGIIWSIWHYPILLFADYNSGTPAWYGLSCFTIMVVGISFIYAYFRLKTGSLWTGVLLHASHNLFIQGVLDPITRPSQTSNYIIGEFGIALAITGIVCGIIFWRIQARLPQTTR